MNINVIDICMDTLCHFYIILWLPLALENNEVNLETGSK